MRAVTLSLRLKGKTRSRTAKVITSVRTPQPRQVHLGYICVDDEVTTPVRERLLNQLVAKWPRPNKPKSIDWENFDEKLAVVRLELAERDAEQAPAPARTVPPKTRLKLRPERVSAPVSLEEATSLSATTVVKPPLHIATPRSASEGSRDSISWDEIAAFLPALEIAAQRMTRDRARAADVVQDAVLRIVSTSTSPCRSSPQAWMFTVLRNVHRDHCRVEQRNAARLLFLSSIELDWFSELAYWQGDEWEAPAIGLEQVIESLHDCIPSHLSSVLRLVGSGASISEIAKKYHISVSTVYRWLDEAARVIRKPHDANLEI